ncbi:MAG: hypothetical protein ACXVED_06130 [Bacteroidia bacterium]
MFYFILAFIVTSFIAVFFRPKPKFGITSEMLEKANGDGPFQYEADGFLLTCQMQEKRKLTGLE